MKPVAIVIIVFMFLKVDVLAQKYNGHFSGDQPGLTSSAELTVQNKQLKGKVYMNGKLANVSGTITDSASAGTIFDVEVSKTYSYRSILRGNELHFFITFPELNYQELELVMQREKKNPATKPASNSATKSVGKKDARLVGVWRYTEVFSSGSGDNYASFSTDYFMEFKADGTVLSWTGKSAGGSGTVSIDGNGSAKVEKGEWYTEGKTLYLTDPVTNQKVSTLFYAEQSRMMLHNGGSDKKIFQRIQ